MTSGMLDNRFLTPRARAHCPAFTLTYFEYDMRVTWGRVQPPLDHCPLHVRQPLQLGLLTRLINLGGGLCTYTPLFSTGPRTYRQKIGAVEKWPNIWGEGRLRLRGRRLVFEPIIAAAQ